jgi:hypothetical protein
MNIFHVSFRMSLMFFMIFKQLLLWCLMSAYEMVRLLHLHNVMIQRMAKWVGLVASLLKSYLLFRRLLQLTGWRYSKPHLHMKYTVFLWRTSYLHTDSVHIHCIKHNLKISYCHHVWKYLAPNTSYYIIWRYVHYIPPFKFHLHS